MAQVNTLTVNDGATTPVSRVFQIFDRNATKTQYRTADAALVRGQAEFRHEAVLASSSRAANRALMAVSYPLEGLDSGGKTTVLSTSIAKIEFNFADGMTKAQRQAFYGLVANFLGNADVKSNVLDIATMG
jgi:hypothetical protein